LPLNGALGIWMIQAEPVYSIKSDADFESDIISMEYGPSELLVTVEASPEDVYCINFPEQVGAFRYMEEGDLTYYWESKQFDSSHLLYEITEGGWLSKEGATIDILGIARTPNWLKEWFVVTRNFSFTVLSNTKPTISKMPNK
jgi:hypothetical protein